MEDEDEKVALRFVIPTGESELTVSDGMVNAFQLCSEQGFEPSWIKENKLLELNPTKTDVFVFDPFEGPGFEHLTKSNKFKCTVVGPMCVIPCLEENSPIPNLPYPLYSTAMKGLWITISGFRKDEKAEIQTLIERMSGMYSPVIHDGVTHIISSKVNSEKYKFAVKIPIPVMTKEWVYEVWKACKRGTVSAVDSRFLQYICPALLGLTVTVSQLSKVDRNAIKKKIETHGGYFLPELTRDKTDILICVSGEGPKFEFAQKWKIPCLNIQWILHSVDKGTALPIDEYRVERQSNKASTPTKEDTTVTGLEEVSMCSTLLNPNDSAVVSRVDETANSSVLETMQDSPKRPRMNIETPKSTNCSNEKRLDRYEDTPEKTPDRIVKTPFRSQEKRLKQETIEQDSQVTNAIILREIIKIRDYLKRVEERIKGVEERIKGVEERINNRVENL